MCEQLRFRWAKDTWEMESIGRCPARVDGSPVTSRTLRPGDTIHLESQLLLLCTTRPGALPELRYYPPDSVPGFGEADPFGMLGESPAVWRLRDDLAFAARQDAHVLLTGPSGCGKELAAQAVHALSSRAEHRLVSRSAATFPAGLIEAELFGNVKDYPNSGMAERRGLIGEADGSTLFLDEIGELPPDLQARLLRVLDADGEYQRLGDRQSRRSDLRLVAATNRPPTALKHDLLGRLTIRLVVPPLSQRPEDIPLIAHHLLLGIVRKDPQLAEQFLEGDTYVRQDPNLVEHLVRHEYTLNVRELSSLLLDAVRTSERAFVELTDTVRARIQLPGGGVTDPKSLTAEAIQAALDRNDGSQVKTYRELGLKNRHTLGRLIKKYGLKVRHPE